MNTAMHSSFLKKSLTIAALIPVVAVTSHAQDTKDSRAATAVTKATNAAEAVLKKLPSIPGAADAKVINIHIGDNYTFGFDEGIDAEEWGMVDNQTEGGQASAATKKPSTSATPEERPSTYRKLDFRKGDVVLIATEQPADSPKQVESPTATITAPETGVAPTSTPTPQPAPIATP
jgi:hypothetical protein